MCSVSSRIHTIDYLLRGDVVVVFNHSKRKIFRLEGPEPTRVMYVNAVSPFGDLLEDSIWPCPIKSRFGDELQVLTEVPRDLPIEYVKYR